MPSFSVRNGEYRDELIKYSYPLDEASTLEEGDVYIGTDLFLDAVLFFKEPSVELPIYISTVDGTSGGDDECNIVLSDATDARVAEALVSLSSDVANVYNNAGVLVGTLVMNMPALQRFIGSITGTLANLQPDTAVFSLDVSFVNRADHMRYISVGSSAVTNDITWVARHGCRWRLELGILYLDMVGDREEILSTEPVISINGVTAKSIWLTNHPESNIRINTANDRLEFTAARDA